ncbi:beta-1,2-xylosyltransferase [Andrographis paniculata]|uniref:beta-1,2-xylosyltransferase n=1 Tax=Andrographis paniculata TaxID=175694 RepID=UPI0021E825CF|nr:beta-1,2-xylosyltransferase [Andrographis paniculata]XP_051133731.1 beta-1,2-xylosyltransferase [Andrographis paniculata]XP_051133732.1 beta-1,2-xylosyltransferase [Andrographis paniculata]
MKGGALRILLSLFTLNSISLYIYLSSHPDHHHRRRPAEQDRHDVDYPPPRGTASLKPWPILPSYLPWTQNADVPYGSCEAYFGNGFTKRVDPLKPIDETQRETGWFRCFYSETLRSSICEGGGIRMIPDRISMARGGEKLESVIGRGEDEELPSFDDGAFEIQVSDRSRNGEKLVDLGFLDQYIQEGEIHRHTMRSLVDSIRLVDDTNFICSEWIEEPTVLVTRFEYANLFHTFTDWYSAYVSSRVTGLPTRPHLVFVDGHCETRLEETWAALFSSITYAKNFTNSVCFRHAILAPLGYETPLFKGLSKHINCRGASAYQLWRKPDHHKTARLSEFGEMIRAAFGLPVNRHNIPKSASTGLDILFVRREDYLAHPRHGGKVQSRLSNEPEVFESIKKWASNHSECKLNVVNGLFAHMSMKEQVRAVQDAAVIVGAHGAGLTHIISATPETVILEIISSEYKRPHFELIAMWKALEYHAINLAGSHADPSVVIDKLSAILRSLGC